MSVYVYVLKYSLSHQNSDIVYKYVPYCLLYSVAKGVLVQTKSFLHKRVLINTTIFIKTLGKRCHFLQGFKEKKVEKIKIFMC